MPPWLWGGNLKAFFVEAQLRSWPHDAKAGQWRVQTEEGWRHSRPSLITVSHISGPPLSRPRFELLKKMTADETPLLEHGDSIVEEVNRLGKRAEETGNPADALAYSQLQTIVARSSELSDVVRDVYENLLQVGIVGNVREKVFTNAGVHVLRREPALIHRLKMPSVWLRVSADERLRLGDISQIQAAAAVGESAFASSQGLYDGIYTLDAYIAPLLAALTPAVWSFHAARTFGTIIYTLGQPIAGTQGSAAELLHVLPSQGTYENMTIPAISAEASAASINWWAGKLNDLFAILGDPAIFSDRGGLYVPAKHLQALLTVEQLFRRVTSIQTSHRDANARRTLIFTVLDTLERLTGRQLPTLCSYAFAQKTLSLLTSSIPAQAAEVLLPAAQRAVSALKELQDGFFIMRHTGSSFIEWNDPRTGINRITPDQAAAQYIKVLRDGTHGHGSNRPNQFARTNALLTHHNGQLPHDLALLGYLYLLDILDRPGDLRASLHQGGK
jgi:hypothetical protein